MWPTSIKRPQRPGALIAADPDTESVFYHRLILSHFFFSLFPAHLHSLTVTMKTLHPFIRDKSREGATIHFF